MVLVKPSVGSIKTDPLRNFKFTVDIHHDDPLIAGAKMGFMSVSGLNVTTEVIPYREGGFNTTTQKMPGQSDFSLITLSKGVIVGDEKTMRWMKQLFSVMQGTGTTAGQEFRATMVINVLAHPVPVGTDVPVKASFKVYGAWPTSIAFSDLDAGANAILVQQMTLAHEGFEYQQALDNAGGTTTYSY